MTSATEKFEKSDFWIFSFLLKSGPVHTPSTAGGGGGGGRSESACPRWDPPGFLLPGNGTKIAISKTWRVKIMAIGRWPHAHGSWPELLKPPSGQIGRASCRDR